MQASEFEFRFLFVSGFAVPFWALQFNTMHTSLAIALSIFFLSQIMFTLHCCCHLMKMIACWWCSWRQLVVFCMLFGIWWILLASNRCMSGCCLILCCINIWFKRLFFILQQVYCHCIFRSLLNTLGCPIDILVQIRTLYTICLILS